MSVLILTSRGDFYAYSDAAWKRTRAAVDQDSDMSYLLAKYFSPVAMTVTAVREVPANTQPYWPPDSSPVAG